MRSPFLLSSSTSVLVVVDVQETFLQVMHSRDTLLANVSLLVQAAHILGIPTLATTQYAARMGLLLPSLAEHVTGGSEAIDDKVCFSCADSPEFMKQLQNTGRTQVLLCGLETHICVSQTAHDLLHIGYQVHVAADAVSSRTLEKHKLGMERIRDAGAKPCAAEAAVYEWMRAAGTPQFREVLKLVR